jgi:hypothetical protein
VFAQPNDAGLLGAMLQRVRALTGRPLRQVLADTNYTGGPDLAVAEAAGVAVYGPSPAAGVKAEKQIPKRAFVWQPQPQPYVCPQGQRLEYEGSSRQKRSGTEAVLSYRYRCAAEHCQGCPLRPRCPPKSSAGRTLSRSEHEGLQEALRQRMQTAEAKALYRLRRQTVELVNADWKEHRKLRRFHSRGLARVQWQVGLMVLAHNLLTLLREREKAIQQAAVNPPENTT